MDAAQIDVHRIMAENIYKAISDQYWKGNLPDIPIRISSRMKVAAGGFKYRNPTRKNLTNLVVPHRIHTDRSVEWHGEITLSGAYLEKGFTNEILVETLKHEVAHLVSFITRGVVDHGEDFKKNCYLMDCSTAQYHNIGTESNDGEFVYFCPVCCDITRYGQRVDKSEGGLCKHGSGGSEFKKHFVGRASELRRILPALTAELFSGDLVREAASTVRKDELQDWPEDFTERPGK